MLDVPTGDWLQQRLGHHLDASRRLLESAGRIALTPDQGRLVDWLAASPIDDAVIAQQGAALLLASLSGTPGTPRQVDGIPMAEINAHIDRHCAHPLQVADLARLCGLSSARFHARFVAATGHTPMEHVRLRRLHKGRELLLGTRLPVGEVAVQVGYSSQSAFTAALVREFGTTPRQLRS